MENIIIVNNLTKDYGFNRGVFDVSFNVAKGEVFGFLGPNGAGKSTTVRHLMGFSKPDSGYTLINELETFKNYDKILKDVGYIPGELALPEGLTGYEFIKMIQDLNSTYNKERLNMLLELFKLNKKTLKMNTKQLSLGSKRKLAIVIAFMNDPNILILDEPTSGLDPFMQEVFIEFLKKEKNRGKTILLSSHLFNEVEQTCDRISIIKDGRIVSTFKTADLKHSKDKVYLVKFSNNLEFNSLITNQNNIFKIIESNNSLNEVKIGVNDTNISKVINYLSSYNLVEFRHIAETLEDYFISFYVEEKDFGGIKWWMNILLKQII